MEAKELMIGDWVQDITPVVIDAISNEDICTYRDENGYITANPSNLKPIPLTAGILEMNGFTLETSRNLTNVTRWWYLRNNNIAIFMMDENFRISTSLTNVQLSCVHQLQHALRLCGIDKEIVL